MSIPHRVLICEDEAVTMMQLRKTLMHAGYDVVGETPDGEEACKLASELKPDLILMDIKLNSVNGIEATKRIVNERPVAVVMLTAFGDEKLVTKAIELGVTTYLVKPISSQQLIPAVMLALARFETLQTVKHENEDLKESLATRKLVDRAKGILMEHKGLVEADAYRHLQKTSRDKCQPMKQTCLEVINAAKILS
ncbi:MAG: response regulator [Chthonomonadales bacterium]